MNIDCIWPVYIKFFLRGPKCSLLISSWSDSMVPYATFGNNVAFYGEGLPDAEFSEILSETYGSLTLTVDYLFN